MAEVLADPTAPGRLFGLDVSTEGAPPRRWRRGSRFRVGLPIGTEEASFAVSVGRLTAEGIAFRAEGPVLVEGEGDLRRLPRRRTSMTLRAGVSAQGVAGDLAAAVALGLLRGGVLDRILRAVKREAER